MWDVRFKVRDRGCKIWDVRHKMWYNECKIENVGIKRFKMCYKGREMWDLRCNIKD